MTLRRLIITSLLIIVIGCISVGVHYLYNFDLNSFRAEIEELASERISKPLSLGRAHLSFKHGPAFVFDDVTIGNQGDDLYLNVKKVFFRLQTLPLLSGEILFSEILLEEPAFFMQIRKAASDTVPLRVDPQQGLLTGELIQSLRVLKGTVNVTDVRNKNNPETYVIEKIRFSIDDFSFLRAGNIEANATLLHRGVRSPMTLAGKYQPKEDTKSWLGAHYQFKISAENLAASSLAPWLDELKSDYALNGQADIKLQLKGIPQSGLAISSELIGKNLTLGTSASGIVHERVVGAGLAGDLRYVGEAVELDNVKFSINTEHGHLELKNSAKLSFSGSRLASVSSSGNLSLRLSSETKPVIYPALARHLNASFLFDLNRTSTGWMLPKGEVAFPGITIGLRGGWRIDQDQRYALTVDIPDASLNSVTALAPGLNRLGLSGQIDAHLSLDASAKGKAHSVGTLKLKDVRLDIPGKLAELNRLNGTVQIDNKTVFAKALRANLGSSPLTVDLTIPDLTNPDIKLHVLSNSIRADELIFTSKKLLLHDVDGVVRIADQTVYLGPIHVKMDGGTDATVHGTVRNFAAADVALEIRGRHGNIDEVIALWEDDHVYDPDAKKAPLGSLNIDIETESGQILGMPFDRATSLITIRNGTLVIGPIHFRGEGGKGLGVGQVLLVHQETGPSLLKISGNVEDFNSQAVYHQLLKRQGLVTGNLNGDFYLEGIAGKQFLPTSLGAFSVQIEKGRLQKLTGLGKILHILNLYPLLTENVQGKGLPFDKITFNTNLTKGILATEDFLMDGNIMKLSMTGHYNLGKNTVDFEMAAMPLGTVDSILSHIPIAGWLLTGSEKALVVAHFKMTGDADDPDVKAVPLESVTTPVLGILKRVFTFPVKIVTDPEKVLINK